MNILPMEIHREMVLRYGTRWYQGIPYGAIVATAMLVDVFHVKEVESHCLNVEVVASPGLHTSIPIDPFGDYSPGRYVWSLIDIEKLVTAVEAKGTQGLWRCDVSVTPP